MSVLEQLADTHAFREGKRSDQAEMVLWLLSRETPSSDGISLKEVLGAFEILALPKPNATRTKSDFRRSKNVRTVRDSIYAPTREFARSMEELLPTPQLAASDLLDLESIPIPPFVPLERRYDLQKMLRAYSYLFLLENSMRGLVERVLSHHLGDEWWQLASNSSMKRKHNDRENNEHNNKWAPARSDYGPLYALDWTDLITLMRKYPEFFQPYVKDINFLHRYEDAGIYRNVVAHNGVLNDDDDFNLIRIYYRDWIKQLS